MTSLGWSLNVSNRVGVAETHAYAYRENGLVKTRTLAGHPMTTYGYDGAGRLRSAVGSGAATWDLSDGGTLMDRYDTASARYVVLPDSHRVSAVFPGFILGGVKYAGPIVRYTHDASGSVTRIQHLDNKRVLADVAITYDDRGRPIKAVDGNGNRIATRRFAWDGTVPYEVIDGHTIKRMRSWEEVDGESRTLVTIEGLTGLHAAQLQIKGNKGNPAKVEALFTDLQGTVTGTYGAKDAKVVSTLETDVYGVPLSSTGKLDVAHQWIGVPRSDKLGLVFTGARLYDERSRMFLSPEPLALGSTGPGLALDPYQSNPYAYGRWNGATASDPNGACLTPDTYCSGDVGASYYVSWYGLRASVGQTYRIAGGHDEAQRFLFQVGYMPTFDLF